ncbi:MULTISPECIES: type VI secretion system baseplate subunit TssK [unclassified Bartonella]|uniref:type VI secretion system baseplate subunit TssK n=1 Tax=unclassified Bartonella TaxID=2645622 RepID=UPI0021C5A079|nr:MULTISPECIES: type VI secretion system baseplate subunit TssK [unclassified Bartonella]UXN05040.1 type VI secretion system baseplate subunit TssK [Bartonella sp. HY406]UXN08090.1 type VI secretion system baseplate subunit TssK [Bartonella sp. HY761]
MSLRNPPIWKDGQFIRPNHFQQQTRYHEYITRRRSDAINAYQYGLESIEINQENLLHGRISIVHAMGIFPDRTVFEIPGETPAPQALDVSGTNIVNETIYLCLPLWTSGVAEILTEESAKESARLNIYNQETRDVTSDDADPWDIEVGQLRLTLLTERDDRSSYSCIPIARIKEKRSDGSVILDADFMPVAYDIQALPQLRRVLDDFTGLLNQRSQQIAQRLGGLTQGGVADVADFMLLQTTNRLGPTFKHLSTIMRIHPERLFELFAGAAGELATFTHEGRLPEIWPVYSHEEPHICFHPLIASLRRSLSVMLEPNAIALPLQKHKYGVLTSPISDSELIETCSFVLAVRAAMPLDRLAKTFPSQVKISSIEKIRELVQHHLPGVVLQPLATAPRQLPYHAEYTYFFLDHHSSGWKNIIKSSGFAFHIAGEFPDLEMQFWAIRGRRDNGGIA